MTHNHHWSPRIVGLLGEAGAGKDTVAEMASQSMGPDRVVKLALASPLKDFARSVFMFSHDQLYGPSESRNAPDPRYSYNHPSRHTPSRKKGFAGWAQGLWEALFPPALPDDWRDQETITLSRMGAWRRFEDKHLPWLEEVLPPGVDFDDSRQKLREWMGSVMDQPNISPRKVLQTLGTEFGRSISENIWIDRGLRHATRAIRDGKWCFITDVRFLNEARAIDLTPSAEVWRIVRPMYKSGVESAGVAGHASESEQRSPEMGSYVSYVINNEGDLSDLRRSVKRLLSIHLG